MTTVDDRIPVFVPICPLWERVPASASTATGGPGRRDSRAGTPRRSPKRARTAGSRSARSHHRRGGPALRCGQRLRRGPGPGDRCAPRRRHTSGPASRDNGASSRESRRRPRGETAFRTRAVHLIGEPGAFGRGAAGARHPRRVGHGRQLEVAPRQVELGADRTKSGLRRATPVTPRGPGRLRRTPPRRTGRRTRRHRCPGSRHRRNRRCRGTTRQYRRNPGSPGRWFARRAAGASSPHPADGWRRPRTR